MLKCLFSHKGELCTKLVFRKVIGTNLNLKKDFNLKISTHESSSTPATGSGVSLKSVDVPCKVPGYPRDGIFSRGRPSFPCTASVKGLHCTAAPAGSLSPRLGW